MSSEAEFKKRLAEYDRNYWHGHPESEQWLWQQRKAWGELEK